MISALLVITGAALGAPLRYLTDLLVRSRHDSAFPWGTLTVNTAGSLILGATAAIATEIAPWILTLLGTGFCGALTTFSTLVTRRSAWSRRDRCSRPSPTVQSASCWARWPAQAAGRSRKRSCSNEPPVAAVGAPPQRHRPERPGRPAPPRRGTASRQPARRMPAPDHAFTCANAPAHQRRGPQAGVAIL